MSIGTCRLRVTTVPEQSSSLSDRYWSPKPTPLLVLSPSRDGPIISFGSEHRHAGEHDQYPRSKASVPNESVDHKCDSSSDEVYAPSTPQTSSRKSAVLGRDGGFFCGSAAHSPTVNPLSFARESLTQPGRDRGMTKYIRGRPIMMRLSGVLAASGLFCLLLSPSKADVILSASYGGPANEQLMFPAVPSLCSGTGGCTAFGGSTSISSTSVDLQTNQGNILTRPLGQGPADILGLNGNGFQNLGIQVVSAPIGYTDAATCGQAAPDPGSTHGCPECGVRATHRHLDALKSRIPEVVAEA
jgi:hypothetical protein